MKSYFFIPSDKPRFLIKIPFLKANEFVIDFEDSVPQSYSSFSISSLKKDMIDFFVRIPIEILKQGERLLELYNFGIRKLVIPKYTSISELELMFSCIENKKLTALELILLVENPTALLGLRELSNFSLLKNVRGIGLGSHDYAASMGMRHTDENLSFARYQILNYCKALNLEAIDTASMNISDEANYQSELKKSSIMGFDAKFLIHPFQLNTINTFDFYSKEEVDFAHKVLDAISNKDFFNIGILRIDGQVIEKPHIPFFEKVVDWYESRTEQ